jgi:DNA repair protein RecO (recombination protein O)
MALFRDRALVLRRFPFGESPLVVHLLTAEGRRVHLVARGAHRPKSRYSGVLDLFDTLELEWSTSARPGAEAAAAGLGELRAGRTLTRRRAMTRDLVRYRAALAGLELAGRAAREEAAEPDLFELAERLLEHLEDLERAPLVQLLAFDLDLLDLLGLAPALRRCAACGGPAPEVEPGRAAFSAARGGRLCRKCAGEARDEQARVGTLRADVLAGAALLAEASPEERAALPSPPPGLLAGLFEFIDRFLEFHLETRLRSRPVSP